MPKNLQGQAEVPGNSGDHASQKTNDLRPIAAKPSFFTALPRKLELPMLLLSFVWFLVIITELVNGTNSILLSLGSVSSPIRKCRKSGGMKMGGSSAGFSSV